MPKATAVCLIDNTALTFEQIAEFCGLHILEVQAIADGGNAKLTDIASARDLILASNLGLKRFKPTAGLDPNMIAQVRARYEILTQKDMR